MDKKIMVVGHVPFGSSIAERIVEKEVDILRVDNEHPNKPTEPAKEWFAFKAMAELTEIPTVYNSSYIGYRSTLTRKQNQIRKAKNRQQRNSRKANR